MSDKTTDTGTTTSISQSDFGLTENEIRNLIYTVRDMRVMLDSDLAVLYQVETKNLNRAAKRNEARFPEDFRFQLKPDEYEYLRCQNGTSCADLQQFGSGGRRYTP